MLESHLNQLEAKNKALEEELESFVTQDEMIKVRLDNRSRSRSPDKN